MSCRNSSSEDNVGSASTQSTAAANATRDTRVSRDTGDTGDTGESTTGVEGERDDGVTRSDAAVKPSSHSSSATAAGTRRRHGDVSRDWYIGLYRPATTTHSAAGSATAASASANARPPTVGYADGRLVGNGQVNDGFHHRYSTDV